TTVFLFCLRSPSCESSTLSLHDALPIFIPSTIIGISDVKCFETIRVHRTGKRRRWPDAEPGCPHLADRRSLRAVSRGRTDAAGRSEEHTSELQSRENLVCRLLLEKKKLR